MVWFWFALAVLLLAVEVYTTQFFAVFIAIGSFAAAIAAGAGAGVLVQVIVGALVALAGALVARPAVVRMIERRPHEPPSPLAGLVGQSGLTADTVGDALHPGHVTLNGERWLAVVEGSPSLAAEVAVEVLSVRGTTLVVRRSAPSTEPDAPASVRPRATGPAPEEG